MRSLRALVCSDSIHRVEAAAARAFSRKGPHECGHYELVCSDSIHRVEAATARAFSRKGPHQCGHYELVCSDSIHRVEAAAARAFSRKGPHECGHYEPSATRPKVARTQQLALFLTSFVFFVSFVVDWLTSGWPMVASFFLTVMCTPNGWSRRSCGMKRDFLPFACISGLGCLP